MATVKQCDLCRTIIKDTDKAGMLVISPALPPELLEFKAEGGGADKRKMAEVMINPDMAKMQRLTRIAAEAMASVEKFELCGECADFTLGTIKQMKGLQSQVEAGAKAH